MDCTSTLALEDSIPKSNNFVAPADVIARTIVFCMIFFFPPGNCVVDVLSNFSLHEIYIWQMISILSDPVVMVAVDDVFGDGLRECPTFLNNVRINSNVQC